MSWVAAGTIGAAVVGGVISSNAQKGAANKAANAQQRATQAAIDQQNLNYDRTATTLNPYINTGTNALNQLSALNSGDYSSFHASPDYQFSLSQGLQGLDRSAAARGSLYSGGHSADVLNFAQGLADQNYNNYYGKLSQLAGMGQNAASNLGSIGAGQSGAIGSYLMGNASNQAGFAYDNANATSNLVGQLGSAAGQLLGRYGTQNTSSYSGGNNALSATPAYTGPNSLATSWPGMNGSGWTPNG